MYAADAEKIFRDIKHDQGIGESILLKGSIMQWQKRHQEALNFYKEASKFLLPAASDSLLFELAYYNSLGGVLINLGYQSEGRKYLEKEFELCKRFSHEDSLSTATIHYNLGLSCLYFGENELGIDHFRKALPVYIREFGENGKRVAQLYNNVGILYIERGDYTLALDYFHQSANIHLYNEGAMYWNLAYPYHGIASAYDEMGNLDTAFVYYQKALAICDTDPYLDRVETASRAALAIYYTKKGMTDEAFREIEKAIDLINKKYFDSHPRLIDLYKVKGDMYVLLDDAENAGTWYGKSRNLIIETYGPLHPLLGTISKKEADMLMNQGDHVAALAKIDEGVKALRTAGSDTKDSLSGILELKIYLDLVIQRAKIYTRKAGEQPDSTTDLKAALETYMHCVAVADAIRSGYLTEESKIFLQGKLKGMYEQALGVCYELITLTGESAYYGHALYFMEKSKASVLSESLQSNSLTRVSGVPDDVLDAELQYARLVKDLKLNLEEASGEKPEVRDSLERMLFATQRSIDSLSFVIRENYPRYHQLKYNADIVSLQDIRLGLKPGSTAIEYFSGDSLWYVMGINSESQLLICIEKSKTEASIKESITSIRDAGSDIQAYLTSAYKVYHDLVQPVIDSIAYGKRLVIIPDGRLGYLPFEALPTTTAAGNARPHYLLMDASIVYANSLTLYLTNSSGSTRYNSDYLGFAPSYNGSTSYINNRAGYRDEVAPLEGTQEEVSFAGDLFSGKVFLAREATESNFKSQSGPSRILHLAMHAQADDKDPMHSRLLFTQGDTADDGFLNAYELYALDLNSELAVLSACNTGSGEMKRGEGIMSLSRAFMYAGCPNVVMSLWQARDLPTLEIMKSFFTNLKERQPKDEALRNAKLSYLEHADPLRAHPANWATFIFMGDNKPISTPPDWKMLLFTALPILLIMGLVLWLMKNRMAKPASK